MSGLGVQVNSAGIIMKALKKKWRVSWVSYGGWNVTEINVLFFCIFSHFSRAISMGVVLFLY